MQWYVLHIQHPYSGSDYHYVALTAGASFQEACRTYVDSISRMGYTLVEENDSRAVVEIEGIGTFQIVSIDPFTGDIARTAHNGQYNTLHLPEELLAPYCVVTRNCSIPGADMAVIERFAKLREAVEAARLHPDSAFVEVVPFGMNARSEITGQWFRAN